MGPEDGAVPGQVIKVVHDDGHEQVQHEEAAEEDEGDEEEVGDVAAASLARLEELPGGAVLLDGSGVTFLSGTACQHDVGPGLSCRTSEAMDLVLQLGGGCCGRGNGGRCVGDGCDGCDGGGFR